MTSLTKILLQKSYSDLLQQPINQIYRDIKSVHKDAFADNERIVFVDDVVESPPKTAMIEYIDRILEHLDIDKFFVEVINWPIIHVKNPTNYAISDSMCITPYLSLEIDVDGGFHRCCKWDRDISAPNVQTTGFVDYFSSIEQQKLKQEFLNGKRPEQCYQCWKVEDAGGRSKRINDNQVFKDYQFDIDYNDIKSPRLLNLDIKLGNKCNLACRICSPRCSSTWSKFSNAPSIEFDWVDNETSTFWEDIISVSGEVRYITFAGGEPLLDKSHRKLLQYFIDNNLSSNVSLHYNTNGTVYADFLFKFWDKFKSVELSFSIDAIENRFEYERYGIPWAQVDENLKKYCNDGKYTVNFFSVVNALNLYYSYELFKYAEELGVDITYSLLEYPKELSITNLPNTAKEEIEKRLMSIDDNIFKNKIKSYIDIMKSDSLSEELKDFLYEQDKLRKQNFADYYPELYKLLD